ncbi:MAG: 4Fe-4S binding protein [Clostridia bacterium]|nr:4Fe-4S binding protein [Clostridia bacterium]
MNLLVSIQWGQVGIVVGIFAAIAIALTALILLIVKLCKVETDERAEAVLEKLAGANCGGCGCSGCSDFAKKLCHGEAKLSSCHVTDSANKAEIASLLGIEVGHTEPTVMIVACSGGDNAKNSCTYVGNPSCDAIVSVGGNKVCSFGCEGGGTCAAVCPQKAITIEEGRSHINTDRCISCGTCALNCPKAILRRIPVSAPVYVACSSNCKGKDVMNACTKGCIGCGLCAKNCPSGAITMVNNLPVIDYKKCTGCLTCVGKCPRKVIVQR